ncbi:MAG: hypothetical protein KJO59_07150, partial [Ignavibacteria bacterium]|nr:hypothetical protein [Ignavibacteria bacterium]
ASYQESDPSSEFIVGTSGICVIRGLRMAGDDEYFFYDDLTLIDCELFVIAPEYAGGWLRGNGGDFCQPTLIDCLLTPSDTTAGSIFHGHRGCIFRVFNCTVASQTNKKSILYESSTEGGDLYAYDSDFSNMASGLNLLDIGNQRGGVYLYRCKLPTTWDFMDAAPTLNEHIVVVEACIANSVEYTGSKSLYGKNLNQSTYYRTGGAVVRGVDFCYEVVTSASCISGAVGHIFRLTTINQNFSSATTVKVFILHSSQGSGTGSDFTDSEIMMTVVVPNSAGSGTVEYNTFPSEYLQSSSDLANSSETWNGGLASSVQQELSITTAGSEGDGLAEIFITVFAPSVTVYVDPKPSIS